MPETANEQLSDEGTRNLEDQLKEAKRLGMRWFALDIGDGDADGLFARLRKAEAERDEARAQRERLREVLKSAADALDEIEAHCCMGGDEADKARTALEETGDTT